MAAEGALNLALRLGISTQQVLHHLMHSPRFYESYRSVGRPSSYHTALICSDLQADPLRIYIYIYIYICVFLETGVYTLKTAVSCGRSLSTQAAICCGVA